MSENSGESVRAVIVAAALISASPVVSWQTRPEGRQCAAGNSGEKPGTVMFWERRGPMEPGVAALSYHMPASASNWAGLVG